MRGELWMMRREEKEEMKEEKEINLPSGKGEMAMTAVFFLFFKFSSFPSCAFQAQRPFVPYPKPRRWTVAAYDKVFISCYWISVPAPAAASFSEG